MSVRGVTRQLRAQYPDALLMGVDAGYFAHCLTDASARAGSAARCAVLRRYPASAGGTAHRRRRRRPSGGRLQRPHGQRVRGRDAGRQLPRRRRAGASGEGGRGSFVRVRVELQRLRRRRWRPAADRALGGASADRVREIQGRSPKKAFASSPDPVSASPACGSRRHAA